MNTHKRRRKQLNFTSCRQSNTTFWSRDTVAPAHGVDTCEATLTATSFTGTTISDGLSQAVRSGKEAAAQMHLEIGTLRTQIQDAQAVPPTREVTTSLVDTRLLGKPESFDGGGGWKDWSVVFRSYACACSAPLGLLLERTERSAGPMLNATLTQSEASCSTQLCFMLVMLCKSTALT